DWVEFDPYILAGIPSFTARIASGGAGGQIQLRANSPTGQLIGSATVPNTGGWENFQDVTGSLTNAPAGTVKLYLVFTGGTGALFDLDQFTLGAPGGPQQPTLLSAGRPATASTTESAQYAASNVTDGNATTRWSSAFADPQWVSVDLGASHS